jgi:Asp-tRNA(Asn)/Glu-tRNA(Gln) amidotransferase A subunit family amidase
VAEQSGIEFTPAYTLRRQIETKAVSPVEVVRNALDRIEALDGTLHSFFVVDPDGAMEAARDAERAVMMGEKLGPLHGIPTSIKDIEAVKGMRFTRGSMAFEHDVTSEDALCTERLRNAGAIVIGKTATPEFGHGGITGGMLGVGCKNPWNPERTSGGSSAGAGASVAAGITAIAQGSDGGGSIRVPSAFCGIYGIKPTQGRVPRRDAGIASWAPINMSTCGPMSRTVRDSAIMLRVMSGPGPDAEGGTIAQEPPDFEAALDLGVKGLRIAFSPDMGGVPVEPDVRAAAEAASKAFEELGAEIAEDEPQIDDYEAVFRNWLLAFNVRAYAFDGDLLETHGGLLGAEFRSDLEQGRNATALEYYEAISSTNLYRARVDRFLKRYDLLLTPALAVTAFEVGSPPKTIAGQPVPNVRACWPFFRLFNLTGHPAAVVPCGFSEEGLPFGLQIVGRMGDEETVLAASAAFEEAQPWADKRPPVS